MSGQQYRVSGPMVTVRTATAVGFGKAGLGGYTRVNLSHGCLLPADVDDKQIRHLLSVKLIELVVSVPAVPAAG